jgi:gliding motility-associated-like protein
MNNEPNIDELLKETFEQFTPEAPDVWQGISKGIQSAQMAQSGANLATAAKSSAAIIKVISAVVAVAGLVTAYVWYDQSGNQPVVTSQSVAALPTTQTEEILPSTDKDQIPVSTPNEKIESSPVNTAKQQTPIMNQSVPVQEEQIPANTSGENPVKEAAQNEQPRSVVSQPEVPVQQAQKPTPKVDVVADKGTKETPAPKPPYNPNEGESGFDKSNITNVFTPDNDGLNDRFVIEINQETLYHLIITDGNGRMVFESFDKTNTWDGKDFKTGIPCQSGNYRWVFQYQFKESDKPRTISGLLKVIN